MTTHDEKILQLIDRIHATAQGRREKTIDGAVQTMERVNRTSYGALRELTENGHKKARPAPATQSWHVPAQEILASDDGLAAQAKAEPVTEVTRLEVTAVMVPALTEETVVMAAPIPTVPPVQRHAPPEGVVSGDGATYGGSNFQQTQVIWFRRLFRRR